MRSLTRNIFNSIIAASLLTLIISFAIIVGIYYNQFQALSLNELAQEASYVSHGISTSGVDFLVGIESKSTIALLTSDCDVAFATSDAALNVSFSDCPEIIEALENNRGSSTRFSAQGTVRTMYYAELLEDGSILWLSAPQPTLSAMLSLVLGSLLLLALTVVILSAIFANRMSAKIVSPINSLDITTPDESTCYRELEPLVRRIRTQNGFISRQMDQLRSRHEEFTAITENMSEGFLLINSSREIISFNTSARRILDLRHESNVISRNDALECAMDIALGGQRDEREISFNGADYRIITSPVYSGSAVSGAVAIILDITEKSRRESMRREFTSNVSHELKTPLTSINAAAEMLSGGMVAQQDLNRFYGMIQNESARLIVLINDIIRLSQLDENAIIDETEVVELRDVAENAINTLRSAADSNGITFSLIGSAEITGVPTILEEMIFNLCDNAVKYNKTNGRVTVKIEKKHEKVVLSVEDTGIGIPPEMHERIFERFYRVDKSRSKEKGGTGLGLSIVRHAASYHNADISVKSRIGEGTSIIVTFNEPNATSNRER